MVEREGRGERVIGGKERHRMKEREKEQERGDDSRHPYMKIEADTGESTAQLKPPELGQLNPIKQSWASSILLPL